MPPGADSLSHPVSPYLIAARLTADAALSHHTALEYHGRAHSVWQHFIYSAARPVKPVTFQSRLFSGARFPAALRRAGAQHLGVVESEQKGLTIRVSIRSR